MVAHIVELSLLGGAFERVARALPFANAVEAAHAASDGRWAALPMPLLNVCLWAAAAVVGAALLFRRGMRRD